MLVLPEAIMAHLVPFPPLFTRRTWRHVPLLVVGAILAPGARMVSSILRILGLDHISSFQINHRVLNRAVWSSLGASRILLGLLVAAFAPDGPLVHGIERRWNVDAGRRLRPPGFTATPCTPVMGTLSRRERCAGSA